MNKLRLQVGAGGAGGARGGKGGPLEVGSSLGRGGRRGAEGGRRRGAGGAGQGLLPGPACCVVSCMHSRRRLPGASLRRGPVSQQGGPHLIPASLMLPPCCTPASALGGSALLTCCADALCRRRGGRCAATRRAACALRTSGRPGTSRRRRCWRSGEQGGPAAPVSALPLPAPLSPVTALSLAPALPVLRTRSRVPGPRQRCAGQAVC